MTTKTAAIIEYIKSATNNIVTLNQKQVNDIINIAQQEHPQPYAIINKFDERNRNYFTIRREWLTEESFYFLSQMKYKKDFECYQIQIIDSNGKCVNTIFTTGTGIDYLIYKFTKK